MTKTERKTMTDVAKTGFTFANDSIFRTVLQAKRAINALVKAGWLVAVVSEFGTEYKLTDAGRDAVAYPASHGLA